MFSRIRVLADAIETDIVQRMQVKTQRTTKIQTKSFERSAIMHYASTHDAHPGGEKQMIGLLSRMMVVEQSNKQQLRI